MESRGIGWRALWAPLHMPDSFFCVDLRAVLRAGVKSRDVRRSRLRGGGASASVSTSWLDCSSASAADSEVDMGRSGWVGSWMGLLLRGCGRSGGACLEFGGSCDKIR